MVYRYKILKTKKLQRSGDYMCDTFVAVRSATHNGEVIFGKNSDRPYNEQQPIVYIPKQHHNPNSELKCTYISIPQVEETYSVLLSKPTWMWGAEMGVNECNVAIGNEAIFDTKEPMGKPALLGMDLLRLALERSSTAYKAIHIICELLEKYGQGGGCVENDPNFTYHNSFLIADPTEGWVLETAGKWWVAQRIEDGTRNISNGLSIRSGYDLAREGIVDHAVTQGYCEEVEFDFAKCFSSGIYQEPTRYTREGRGRYLLRTNYGEISPQIMMEILRDHSTGICMHGGFRTTASQVSHLSKETTSIHWFTGSPHPCISLFKPFIVPSHDTSKVIDIWKQREHFDPITREDVIKKLNSLEQELIQNIEWKRQKGDLFMKEITNLTQEALQRELTLISES